MQTNPARLANKDQDCGFPAVFLTHRLFPDIFNAQTLQASSVTEEEGNILRVCFFSQASSQCRDKPVVESLCSLRLQSALALRRGGKTRSQVIKQPALDSDGQAAVRPMTEPHSCPADADETTHCAVKKSARKDSPLPVYQTPDFNECSYYAF